MKAFESKGEDVKVEEGAKANLQGSVIPATEKEK